MCGKKNSCVTSSQISVNISVLTVAGDGVSHLELLSIVLCLVISFSEQLLLSDWTHGCVPTLFLESGNRFISVLIIKWLTNPAILVVMTVWTVKANIIMFYLWNSTVEVKIVELFVFNWLLPTLMQTVTSNFISFYKRIIYTRLDIFTIWSPSVIKTEVIIVSEMLLTTCQTVWCHREEDHNVKKDSLCVFLQFMAWLRKCSACHHTTYALLDHDKINQVSDRYYWVGGISMSNKMEEMVVTFSWRVC